MSLKFGLIGKRLSHSFSPGYFNSKFSREGIHAFYEKLELEQIEDFRELKRARNFSGFNVTLPYKEVIIDFLDDMDPIAAEIGAVNTIKISSQGYKGYNTDVYGFELSLLNLVGDASAIKKALILGSGGGAKAVQYVLRKLGIDFLTVSRLKAGDLTYGDIDKKLLETTHLIVNTTPLGMFPDIETFPDIPYDLLSSNYFLFDLIYNPEKTIFLTKGWQRGSNIKNGLEMLILQAEKAWEIWNQPETT